MKKPKSKKSKSRRRKSGSQTAGRTAGSTGNDNEVAVQAPAPTPKQAAKPAKSAKAEPSGPKVWWDKGSQFFREVKVELKKVTWPTRKETVTTTGVVIALVLISATFLGLIDLGLSRLIRTLVG